MSPQSSMLLQAKEVAREVPCRTSGTRDASKAAYEAKLLLVDSARKVPIVVCRGFVSVSRSVEQDIWGSNPI